MDERKLYKMRKRYRDLVDKDFLHGLSIFETIEKRRLGKKIDKADAPHYKRMLEMLHQLENS